MLQRLLIFTYLVLDVHGRRVIHGITNEMANKANVRKQVINEIANKTNITVEVNLRNYDNYGYEFNADKCKEIADRILCGYSKNIGEINPNKVTDLGNGCRLRRDRIECGYVKQYNVLKSLRKNNDGDKFKLEFLLPKERVNIEPTEVSKPFVKISKYSVKNCIQKETGAICYTSNENETTNDKSLINNLDNIIYIDYYVKKITPIAEHILMERWQLINTICFTLHTYKLQGILAKVYSVYKHCKRYRT